MTTIWIGVLTFFYVVVAYSIAVMRVRDVGKPTLLGDLTAAFWPLIAIVFVVCRLLAAIIDCVRLLVGIMIKMVSDVAEAFR